MMASTSQQAPAGFGAFTMITSPAAHAYDAHMVLVLAIPVEPPPGEPHDRNLGPAAPSAAGSRADRPLKSELDVVGRSCLA
jgi:hypothetical protein